MDFWQHAVISAGGSAGIYLSTKSLPCAAAFSLSGIFIDLDHFIDYWRETGLNLDLSRFFKHFHGHNPKQLWLFLHAWEWVFAGVLGCLFNGGPQWLWWLVAGWFLHLVLDQLFNRFYLLGYSFFYRASVDFRTPSIVEVKV